MEYELTFPYVILSHEVTRGPGPQMRKHQEGRKRLSAGEGYVFVEGGASLQTSVLLISFLWSPCWLPWPGPLMTCKISAKSPTICTKYVCICFSQGLSAGNKRHVGILSREAINMGN